TRRDINDSLLPAIGPISEAEAGQLSRCSFSAFVFVQAVFPEQFAAGRIESHYCATRSGSRVEDTIGHQWCRLEIEFSARSKIVRFEAPRHFQLAEVVAVDLIESSVSRAPEIRTIRAPFSR